MNYVKREKDVPIDDPAKKPIGFFMTQFHIVFVYPTNFTVLSSITEEIVYSMMFAYQIRNVVFDDAQRYVLTVSQAEKQHDDLKYCQMDSEDRDAWKQYLKVGKIQQALDNCKSSQRPNVAGIYADQLFAKKSYKEAARYYAQSSKTFEEVSLRFIQENLYTALIEYLELMLGKIRAREASEGDNYRP